MAMRRVVLSRFWRRKSVAACVLESDWNFIRKQRQLGGQDGSVVKKLHNLECDPWNHLAEGNQLLIVFDL